MEKLNVITNTVQTQAIFCSCYFQLVLFENNPSADKIKNKLLSKLTLDLVFCTLLRLSIACCCTGSRTTFK